MGMGGGGSIPQAGLTPLQLEQYQQGRTLIDQNSPMAGAMAQRAATAEGLYDSFLNSQDAFMRSRHKFIGEQGKLARGGLLTKGMHQVGLGLARQPDMAAMQALTMGRFGVSPTADDQAELDRQQAAMRVANTVGLRNQARLGLANAQRDMRFGGY